MPYNNAHPERMYPTLAKRKRKAAAQRESEARKFRADADALDKLWHQYEAERLTKRPVAS